MFIRLVDVQKDAELNLNTRNLVTFEPANDNKNSKITLTTGQTFVVDATCRTLRHHIKKANEPFEGGQSGAAAHALEGEGKR